MAGSLPKALKEQGVDVRVILPKFITKNGVGEKYRDGMEHVYDGTVPVSWRTKYVGIDKYELDGVIYYFVDNEEYFAREGLYGYDDDAERFSFFCRAVLNCLPALDFFPDVINANDWHAGLVPVFLKLEHQGDERYEKIKTIYTIHNLKYQGVFTKDIMGDVLGFAWEYRKPDKSINVKFNGNAYMKEQPDGSLKLVHENAMTVMAVPYDVPIVGYHNKTVNTLRLWNAEVNRDFSDYGMLTHEQMRQKNEYRSFVESITEYLYPDDSSSEGKRMRLIQEYFLVSAGTQSIIRHYDRSGGNIRELDSKIAIHINDTHPALCVAELMRILVDEYDLEWDEAWKITRGVVAYTNHTIMPEALEKWPVDMFKTLLPRIYMVIDEVNRRHLEYVRARYPNNIEKVRSMSIIEKDEVHMARLAIVGAHSVNGVARIHTDILKGTTLHDFYEYWPRMFNNKTNGITHRRWLMGNNPELADLIDRTIRSRVWHRHPEQLDLFNESVDDRKVQKELEEIKLIRKTALANFIKKHQGIELNPNTIFDIQVKRIHSYKRQLMNALHIIWQYEKIKSDPSYKPLPTTYLFGGKAAAGYYIAKETIRLIHAIANKINNDNSIDNRLKVVFIENFGVSIGEIVYPAADVSEQISTASKEASGTGNMKFMMNGAITIGTLDGANVEIREAVGDDNIVIFGLKAAEVFAYYENGTYSAWNEYTGNPNARLVVDKLTDGSYGNFHPLRDYLIQGNDEFFILKDFNAYIDAHHEIYASA